MIEGNKPGEECGPYDVRILLSSDAMAAFIELQQPEPVEVEPDTGAEKPPAVIALELLQDALGQYGIIYGVDEARLKALADDPVWGQPVQIAQGTPPVDGEDGFVEYYIRRDSEYRPDFGDQDKIDYMNLEYFQMATAEQVLCKVHRETPGVEGTNVYGKPVRAVDGRPPAQPKGENTYYDESGVFLKAKRDGLIRFVRDIIDINEVLNIPGNVDFGTGNIRFSGDVTIGGDVSPGFTVEATGNIRIRGMVEGAVLRSGGDIYIGRGINGSGNEPIFAGGNLQSGYVENASVDVEGDIASDYIINSDIVCRGNINLSGRRELLIGGTTEVHGNLTAKYIGSERETPTKVTVIGTRIRDDEQIEALEKEIREYSNRAASLKKILDTFRRAGATDNPKIKLAQEQLHLLQNHLTAVYSRLKELEKSGKAIYQGAIFCKSKKFRGAKIYFDDVLFHHGNNEFDRCKIFWADGEIHLGAL